MFLTSCLTCCQEEENVAMEEILRARVTPRPFRPQQRFKVATSSCTDSQDESAKAKPGAKNFNHGIQLLRSEQSEPQLHIDSQTIQKAACIARNFDFYLLPTVSVQLSQIWYSEHFSEESLQVL